MNFYKSTTELKSEARELLLGKYASYIRALVLIESIVFLVSMIVSAVLPANTIWGTILDTIFSFIINLISAVFSLGIIHFTMNMCRNLPYHTKDVWFGLSFHPDKAIICRFLLTIMEFICLLPTLLCVALYYLFEIQMLVIVIALFLVFGIYAITVLHLTYDFVYYTVLDYPDSSVRQLFSYCHEVMKGHRIRLFYLQMSFLPLLFLSVLSCGIGLLFVIPYRNVAVSKFYLDVFHQEENLTENDTTTNVQITTEGNV